MPDHQPALLESSQQQDLCPKAVTKGANGDHKIAELFADNQLCTHSQEPMASITPAPEMSDSLQCTAFQGASNILVKGGSLSSNHSCSIQSSSAKDFLSATGESCVYAALRKICLQSSSADKTLAVWYFGLEELGECAAMQHEVRSKWKSKIAQDLELIPVPKLATIKKILIHVIQEVSGKLIPLLQERNTLQDEIDARNIAIEQLLKLTWKQVELESRPIQMSVVMPSGDTDDCNTSG